MAVDDRRTRRVMRRRSARYRRIRGIDALLDAACMHKVEPQRLFGVPLERTQPFQLDFLLEVPVVVLGRPDLDDSVWPTHEVHCKHTSIRVLRERLHRVWRIPRRKRLAVGISLGPCAVLFA